MYKAVKACGSIAEFIRQDEKTLMRWAAGILGKAGKKITQRDMELLLTKTGTDMGESQDGDGEAYQLYRRQGCGDCRGY